jgi:predicted NAD/FAD-binding protein
MNNHYLLQLTGDSKWLTIEGGARVYVDAITSSLPEGSLRLSTKVVSVKTMESGRVLLATADGGTEAYDHVILACHSDTSLAILKAGGISEEEERILGGFQWSKSQVVLHSDEKLMPIRRAAWSCWNHLASSSNANEKDDQVSVTFWMNELQHLPEKNHGLVFATLNPPFEPSPKTVFGRFKYEHPVIDSRAVTLQEEMKSIQNTRGISYAGAWLGYGFHEDGFTSGLRAVVDNFPDVKVPYDIQYADREPELPWITSLFDLLHVASVGLYGFVLIACISLAFSL